jgi:FkbM family methyltransferase
VVCLERSAGKEHTMLALTKRSFSRIIGYLGYEIQRKRRDEVPKPFLAQKGIINKHSPTIFDVGAYVGAIAKTYRRLYPNAVIHCFEPFPDSFASLEENMRSDTNATYLHKIAISDKHQIVGLHCNMSSTTNSILATHDQAAKFWGNCLLETVEHIEVECTTIDQFCTNHMISMIDILKLDIQGAEFRALKGAEKMLSKQAVGLIYTEIIMAPTYDGQYRIHDYLNFLNSLGYNLFGIYNPIYHDLRLIQVDVIFVSRSLTVC